MRPIVHTGESWLAKGIHELLGEFPTVGLGAGDESWSCDRAKGGVNKGDEDAFDLCGALGGDQGLAGTGVPWATNVLWFFKSKELEHGHAWRYLVF